eukprot:403335133
MFAIAESEENYDSQSNGSMIIDKDATMQQKFSKTHTEFPQFNQNIMNQSNKNFFKKPPKDPQVAMNRQFLRSAGPNNQRRNLNNQPLQNLDNNFGSNYSTLSILNNQININGGGGPQSMLSYNEGSSKSKQRLYLAINSPLRMRNQLQPHQQSQYSAYYQSQDTQNQINEKTKPYRVREQKRVTVNATRNSSVDFSKQDREQLEYNQMFTKQENNELEKNVVKLKTRIQMLYQELSKKDKLIEQFISNSVPDKYIQDSYIVNAYKTQILELNRKLEDSQEEKELLKRSLPFTLNQELQVEIEEYKQECLRLRKMLDTHITDSEMNKLFGQQSWRGIDIEDKEKDAKLIENEKEMQLMKQTIEEYDQNNQDLISKLNEMAIMNHKLSRGKGKGKGVSLKQLEENENIILKKRIADLERQNSDYKLEIQRFYMPKIIYILQTLALQGNHDIVVHEEMNETGLRQVLESYLPLTDLLIDQTFIETHKDQLKFLCRDSLKALQSEIQAFVDPYIQGRQLSDDLLNIASINFEGQFSAIKNFFKYLCQQCYQSDSYLSLKVFNIFFQRDQSNNNQEMVDDDEQVQKIKRELRLIDLSGIYSYLDFINHDSVIDQNTFLKLLKVEDQGEGMQELLKLLHVKNNNKKLINLQEFKLILHNQVNEPNQNMDQDNSAVKLIKQLQQENFKQSIQKFTKKIVVQLGSKQKSMDYIDQQEFREWIQQLVQNSKIQLDTDILEQTFSELRLSEMRPEVLIFKKLEQLINQ